MVVMRQIAKPIPRFFYQKPGGHIVDCTEQEAAILEKDPNRRHFLRYGYSDGTAYAAYLKNCGVKPDERIPYTKAREIMKAAGEAELAVAKGNFRVPMLQEWFYDGSVPMDQRKDTRNIVSFNE